MEQIDKLLDTALQTANASGTLDDLNKAADIAKAAAEAGKARADTANSSAQIRLESWKSFATFLVPVVSFLTIAFTVYMQYLQLQETQRQNEATQWREFLTSVSKKRSPNTAQSDPTFAPRLRSFFSSPTYKDQAISISKRMMGGIASDAGFKDLFGVTFVTIGATTLPDVVEIGQLLYSNLSSLYAECAAFVDDLDDAIRRKLPETYASLSAGICAPTIPERAIKDLGLNLQQSQKLSQLRRDLAAFESEVRFLSEKLGDLLRANYFVGSPPAKATIRLNRVYILSADLSNVDFSSFDISDTVIDNAILKGAKLTPKVYGHFLDIRGSAWWEASAIDHDALKGLITDYFPYYNMEEDFPENTDVNMEHYRQRILALCIPLQSFCAPDRLPFGKKRPPNSP
jgi:hypothetical protein